MTPTVRRGEIYYADLNPIVGSEQGGIRPVLVLQNDVGNTHSPTIIVAALTGSHRNRQPTHCRVGTFAGLPQTSVVLLEQLRTIDKQRLLDYVCTLNEEDMRRVDAALAVSVGLSIRGEEENDNG